MKKIFLLAITFVSFYVANAQTSAKAAPTSTPAPKDITKAFEFKNDAYDFGRIPFGKPVEYDLYIKNITKDTAVLDNVQVSCGCTTPKYEKGKKFLPGETYKVTLGFNGSAQGQFTRTVTIYLNNNAYTKQISFKGETYTTPAAPAPANNATEKTKPSGN